MYYFVVHIDTFPFVFLPGGCVVFRFIEAIQADKEVLVLFPLNVVLVVYVFCLYYDESSCVLSSLGYSVHVHEFVVKFIHVM